MNRVEKHFLVNVLAFGLIKAIIYISIRQAIKRA